MRLVIILLLSLSVLSSCVAKARYAAVIKEIESKEKQRAKMEVQIRDLKIVNANLTDSASRIGN